MDGWMNERFVFPFVSGHTGVVGIALHCVVRHARDESLVWIGRVHHPPLFESTAENKRNCYYSYSGWTLWFLAVFQKCLSVTISVLVLVESMMDVAVLVLV